MTPYLLHQAVAVAVARHPRQPALRAASGESWSYAELWAASGGLARRLLDAGLRPGMRAGIWMRKSPAAVAALLGVLRAGGVYVPFDAFAPPARIAAMARDCALWGLLADDALAGQARAWTPPPAWIAPSGWTARLAEAPSPGLADVGVRTSDDVAYILYTSGSTGTPKGVMLTHAHALNFIAWAGSAVGLEPGDRLASQAPFHFDLSIFDLWAGLSHGAEVCLLDPVTARFPAAVADWIADCGIRVWYSTPSALVAMLPQLPRLAKLEPGLRAIVFAGEVFPPAPLRQWRQALPHAAFHNWYGPTETNVCCYYRLPALDPAAPSSHPEAALPIGRACPNFELAVLGDGRQPVADGEAGFLWARGPGILAGYWGDAARTAAVTCLRSPLSGGEPQRWYNTGDCARREADGELYFEGRRDALIKLRGYRVSLLEIEAALAAAPGVAQAAVVAVPDAAQPVRLHAFVSAHASGSIGEPAGLRAWLRQRLPQYMIPDRIEMVLNLPQTSTGKLDRQRLTAQAMAASEAATAS